METKLKTYTYKIEVYMSKIILKSAKISNFLCDNLFNKTLLS